MTAEHIVIAIGLAAIAIGVLWSWHRELYLRRLTDDFQDSLTKSITTTMASTQAIDQVVEKIRDLNQLSKEHRGELIALLLNIEQRNSSAMDQVRQMLSRTQTVNFNAETRAAQVGDGNSQR